MKRVFLLTLGMVLSASVASANFGAVGNFADLAGTNCNMIDTDPTDRFRVWTVHVLPNGASAVEYAIPAPSCFGGGFFDGWSQPFSISPGVPVNQAAGNNGTSTAYGSCLITTAWIGRTTWDLSNGATGPCCFYPVVAHEIEGGPSVTACPSEEDPFPPKEPLATFLNTINGDSSCPCGATPTHNSTWGGVKALYRN